jgi:hypothetical protein
MEVFALDTTSALIAMVFGLEVVRRNPRLGAARVLLLGSLAFAAWCAMDIMGARHADQPFLREVIGLAAEPLVTFSACTLLHFSFLFPVDLGLRRSRAPLLYLPALLLAARSAPLAALALERQDIVTSSFGWLGYDSLAVNVLILVFVLRKLVVAHRGSHAEIQRSRIRVIGAGLALTVASATTFTSLEELGVYSIPSDSISSLPSLLALSYSVLRYQVFDLQALKRESAIIVASAALFLGAAALLAGAALALTDASTGGIALVVVAVAVAAALFREQVRAMGTAAVERLLPGLKWKECRVREALLVHHSGGVLAERRFGGAGAPGETGSARYVGEMLVIVQAMLRESLALAERETMKGFTLGERKMLVEHGSACYLVVEFEGFESPELRPEVRRVLGEVGKRYGRVLERWGGDMADFAGAERFLAGLGGAGG